jgi:leucyl-tRNA synthetase
LYARFWTKFLKDRGFISFDEPFQKMINQGMILGRSSFVYRDRSSGKFVSLNKKQGLDLAPIHVDINMVDNDRLDMGAFKASREEYAHAAFILEDDGTYICGSEVEKMSKSKFNVQTPDDLVEQFGADTLRMYEMFLGPLEQAKPWDTKGIEGVHRFLKKLWRLFYDDLKGKVWVDEKATPAEVLIPTVWLVLLVTIYVLGSLGIVISRATTFDPVTTSIALRASSTVPLKDVRVTSAAVTSTVVMPAIACSISSPRLLLVV